MVVTCSMLMGIGRLRELLCGERRLRPMLVVVAVYDGRFSRFRRSRRRRRGCHALPAASIAISIGGRRRARGRRSSGGGKRQRGRPRLIPLVGRRGCRRCRCRRGCRGRRELILLVVGDKRGVRCNAFGAQACDRRHLGIVYRRHLLLLPVQRRSRGVDGRHVGSSSRRETCRRDELIRILGADDGDLVDMLDGFLGVVVCEKILARAYRCH